MFRAVPCRASPAGVSAPLLRQEGCSRPAGRSHETATPCLRDHATGASAGYATASAAGLPDMTTAPPAEYDGPGTRGAPEHLLLAAVSSCFLFTFRRCQGVARGLRRGRSGRGRHGRPDRRNHAVYGHRPPSDRDHASGADAGAVQRAIEKAASRCLVSASLETPVSSVDHPRVCGGRIDKGRRPKAQAALRRVSACSTYVLRAALVILQSGRLGRRARHPTYPPPFV